MKQKMTMTPLIFSEISCVEFSQNTIAFDVMDSFDAKKGTGMGNLTHKVTSLLTFAEV